MTKIKQDFFDRNRGLIKAFIGLQFAPLILIGAGLIGISIWLYVNNDANFHQYKYLIIDGYNQGVEDGHKDKSKYNSNHQINLGETPWGKYSDETIDLKVLVKKELEEYLAKFPAEERSRKLIEKKQNNMLLPLEQELAGRFHKPVAFYADYVDKKIKRQDYDSDSAYRKALKKEAWNVGYVDGYIRGIRWGKPLFGKSKWR